MLAAGIEVAASKADGRWSTVSGMTRIRLTRKFAERIDGIDLSQRRTGEIMDVSSRDARLLMAEGWASADDAPVKEKRPRAASPQPKKK
jgi:hypothetical protein